MARCAQWTFNSLAIIKRRSNYKHIHALALHASPCVRYEKHTYKQIDRQRDGDTHARTHARKRTRTQTHTRSPTHARTHPGDPPQTSINRHLIRSTSLLITCYLWLTELTEGDKTKCLPSGHSTVTWSAECLVNHYCRLQSVYLCLRIILQPPLSLSVFVDRVFLS